MIFGTERLLNVTFTPKHVAGNKDKSGEEAVWNLFKYKGGVLRGVPTRLTPKHLHFSWF